MLLLGDFFVKGDFGSDVVPFGLDSGIVYGDPSQLDERLQRFLVPTFGRQPPRREGDEEHRNSEQGRWEDLQKEREAVGPMAADVSGAECQPVRADDAKHYGEFFEDKQRAFGLLVVPMDDKLKVQAQAYL